MGQFKGLYNKVNELKLSNIGLVLLLGLVFGLSQAHGDIIKSIEDLEKLEEQKRQIRKPTPQKPEASQSNEKESVDKSSGGKIPGVSSKAEKGQPASSPQQQGAESKPTGTAREQSPQDRSKLPIRLKSDGRSTYSRNGGLIHLRENVVVTQEDLRLQADEAKVFVDDKRDDDRIDRVELTGSVKFNKFDQLPSEQVSANGNRAIFYNDRQIVEMIGNARIWKGNQLIRGKRVIYDIQTGMIEVDQAVGVMQPEENLKNE